MTLERTPEPGDAFWYLAGGMASPEAITIRGVADHSGTPYISFRRSLYKGTWMIPLHKFEASGKYRPRDLGDFCFPEVEAIPMPVDPLFSKDTAELNRKVNPDPSPDATDEGHAYDGLMDKLAEERNEAELKKLVLPVPDYQPPETDEEHEEQERANAAEAFERQVQYDADRNGEMTRPPNPAEEPEASHEKTDDWDDDEKYATDSEKWTDPAKAWDRRDPPASVVLVDETEAEDDGPNPMRTVRMATSFGGVTDVFTFPKGWPDFVPATDIATLRATAFPVVEKDGKVYGGSTGSVVIGRVHQPSPKRDEELSDFYKDTAKFLYKPPAKPFDPDRPHGTMAQSMSPEPSPNPQLEAYAQVPETPVRVAYESRPSLSGGNFGGARLRVQNAAELAHLDDCYQGAKPSFEELIEAVDVLVRYSHGNSRVSGWWPELRGDAGLRGERVGPQANEGQRNFGELVALIHSEVSECLEGYRRHSTDEHLPAFDNYVVELADAMHRICDLAGAMAAPLGRAYASKGEYNLNRADHKKANRSKPGGKQF